MRFWFRCVCLLLVQLQATSSFAHIPIDTADPQHIAVLELHRSDVSSRKTRKMTDKFREELSRYAHLKVLSRAESKALLDYQKDAIIASGQVSSLQAAVDEAKREYFQLHLERSSSLVEKVVAQALSAPLAERDNAALLEAYTVQGIVAMAQNQRALANEAFSKLVYYNPTIKLDQRYFAPSIVKKVRRTREKTAQQQTGMIQVHSVPAASDVYVNGVFKGTTPLQVSGYAIGEHAVVVKAANYQSSREVVQVKADTMAEVAAHLPWKAPNLNLSKDMAGFHRDQFNNFEHLTETSGAAAKAMQVRKLILIDLDRENDQAVVKAYIVDRDLATFHQPQSVSVRNFRRELGQTSERLASKVLDEMHRNIMDDPGSLAAAPYYGDVSLLGKHRPLLKNPWFWSAVGLVVVGAVTGGILAGATTNTTGAINVVFR